jgi:hypothetical protein
MGLNSSKVTQQLRKCNVNKSHNDVIKLNESGRFLSVSLIIAVIGHLLYSEYIAS